MGSQRVGHDLATEQQQYAIRGWHHEGLRVGTGNEAYLLELESFRSPGKVVTGDKAGESLLADERAQEMKWFHRHKPNP